MGAKKKKLLEVWFFYLTDIKNYQNVYKTDIKKYVVTPKIEFRPVKRFLNKDENFICSVNRGDIINIRSEYRENAVTFPGLKVGLPFHFFKLPDGEEDEYTDVFLHTATLTFLFKEMSFPNVLELNPLNP